MAWEIVAEHAGITALIHVVEKLRRVRFLRYRVIRPGAEIRVALSAVLRLHEGGRYALVQNLHRAETYGPFGGVYKHHDPTPELLDQLPFRPEDLGPGTDMANDLRGYVPRGRLHAYLNWFAKGDGRETAPECLQRELQEELREVGVTLKMPKNIQFKRVRVVEEGPEVVPGLNFAQYRIVEVYEPVGPSDAKSFFAKLFGLAQEHQKLLVVSGGDILKGRSQDGRVIAHHADYLIGSKRIHPDDRPMRDGFTRNAGAG